MAAVLAGFLAALFSFFANRLALRSWGRPSLVWAVPLLEETAKTFSAFLLGAPILMTHGIFGLVEGALDLLSRRNPPLAPPLLSVAGHLLFGALTQFMFHITGALGIGVAAAAAAHCLWNLATALAGPRKGKEER